MRSVLQLTTAFGKELVKLADSTGSTARITFILSLKNK